MKHQVLCLLAAMLAVPLFGSEYESNGFCAKLSNNGIISEATYQGKKVLTDCQINGSYILPPGAEKYDTHLYQVRDYKGVAKITREGDKMTVTTESILGNEKIPEAAKYVSTTIFTPDEITFHTKITLMVDMLGYGTLFSRNFNIPSELIAGRGVRWVTSQGKEELHTVPLEYQKDFRIRGKDVSFSLPGFILQITTGDDCSMDFWDSRQWKVPLLSFVLGYKEHWSPKLVTFPAGKSYEWEFKISMKKE